MSKKIASSLIAALMIGMFIFPHFAHADITSDLQIWFKFDEGSGTTAIDSSGNSNIGTLQGAASYVAGKIGSFALSSDGTTGNGLSFSTPVGLGSTWTWASWVYITDYRSNAYENLFTNGPASGLWTKSGQIDFCCGDRLSAGAIPLNTWTHIVVTYNSGTVNFYFNGVLDANTYTGVSGFSPNGSLCDGGTGGECLSGSLDDERFYFRVLSQADITELYNYGNSPVVASTSWRIKTPPNSLALSTGLVGWWTFDGKDTAWTSSSAATTLDRSGNGNTGTLTNMNQASSPVIGKLGQGLKFNGTAGAYVDVNHLAALETGDETFSFWIKPGAVSGLKMILQQFDTGPNRGWVIYQSGSQLEFQSGSNDLLTSAISFVPGTWVHIVAVNSGGVFSIYKNGVLNTGPTSITVTDNPTASDFTIGGPSEAGISAFDGSLDDVRVYDRALSASEVQLLFGSGLAKVRASPLVAPPTSCTSSYANTGGTGNRTSIITLTGGSTALLNNVPANSILDGDTASNGRQFFRNGIPLDGSTTFLTFDFGSGHTPVITESKYYQQDSTDQGVWKWQGSNDNSTWTDIGGTFSLATAPTTVSTSMSANTTGYRYYRLLGISGAISFNPWVYQIEFKICGY